jgi:hypothetical protein
MSLGMSDQAATAGKNFWSVISSMKAIGRNTVSGTSSA